MQSGQPLDERVQLAARLGAAGVAAGRDEQDVAGSDGDALRPFRGLELVGRDGVIGFEVRTSEGARYVEQHPATDDAVGERHHRVAGGAGARDLLRAAAVVHLAAHEHVAERVQMRRTEAVDVGADEVAGGLVARDAGGLQRVTAREHVVLRRERLLGVGGEREVVREADRLPAADRGRGRRPPLGREVGEGAALVVCAPAAPGARPRRRARRARCLWARSQRGKITA